MKGILTGRVLWNALALFVAVCLVSAAAIWLLSADARRQIDGLARANGDSVQWSLAQFEVEHKAYENSLLKAMVAEEPDVSEVRKRFNILYSRAQTIQVAAGFVGVRDALGVSDQLADIQRYLDISIPLIDSEDLALLDGVPQLLEGIQSLDPDIRAISLAGVRAFAADSQVRRENVGGALVDLGVIMFMLLAIVLAAAAILLHMARASKHQAEAISETQNRLQSIVGTSLDGILVVHRNGRILDYNGAAEGIFGYTREEALGADMAEMIIPDHLRKRHAAGMTRYLETGEKRVVGKGLVKLEAKDKNGRVFPVEFSISTADTADGEVFVSYIRDISDRVAAEAELVDARDKAVTGEKAKAHLLAVMSHEMRTPLNGVLGTLQLLNNTNLDARQRQLVDVMDQSGLMLLEHVNNVLDISRVDAGKAEVTLQDFRPLDLVENIVEGLHPQAELRGNSLKIHQTGQPTGMVFGDMARVRQILFNLLGNAIKFTENGSITVEIEGDKTSDDVTFRISDTGLGIAEEDMDRIFEDFVTLDPSYQREVEGTGLGLGIVKRLVTLLDGEVGVESELGMGSVFWVRLPLPEVEHRVRSKVSSQPRRTETAELGLEVLVVEDNEINRMVVREMLRQLGCNVSEAADGQDGVDQAKTRRFDLILMDISMPKLDGVNATRMIRMSDGPNKDTRIIALTAHALDEDVQRFRDAGMADVVTKPLVFDELTRILMTGSPLGASDKPSRALAELLTAFGPDMAREVRNRAKGEIGSGLEDMTALLHNRQPHQEIAKLAHKLAGSAGVIGLVDVRMGLIEIEKMSVPAETDSVLSMIASVRQALENAPEI